MLGPTKSVLSWATLGFVALSSATTTCPMNYHDTIPAKDNSGFDVNISVGGKLDSRLASGMCYGNGKMTLGASMNIDTGGSFSKSRLVLSDSDCVIQGLYDFPTENDEGDSCDEWSIEGSFLDYEIIIKHWDRHKYLEGVHEANEVEIEFYYGAGNYINGRNNCGCPGVNGGGNIIYENALNDPNSYWGCECPFDKNGDGH